MQFPAQGRKEGERILLQSGLTTRRFLVSQERVSRGYAARGENFRAFTQEHTASSLLSLSLSHSTWDRQHTRSKYAARPVCKGCLRFWQRSETAAAGSGVSHPHAPHDSPHPPRTSTKRPAPPTYPAPASPQDTHALPTRAPAAPRSSSPAARLTRPGARPDLRTGPGGATSRENLALPRAIPIGQARTNEEPLRPIGPAHTTPPVRSHAPLGAPYREPGVFEKDALVNFNIAATAAV